jgi:hypothetical protein
VPDVKDLNKMLLAYDAIIDFERSADDEPDIASGRAAIDWTNFRKGL